MDLYTDRCQIINMKIRKLSIIIGCLCILSFIGIFCFENHLLNIPSKESGNHADSIDLENFSVGHEEDEVITNTVLYMDNLSIEVLSFLRLFAQLFRYY